MASSVPAALKAADISRFAMRANQLEKVKPVISYWATLYMVETILSKGLEEVNDDCRLFTANLMDKLEQWKNENAGNDAIRDDLAAQAYVEQFALETFDRADKALQSRTVTVRTADTFGAAGTFLDLLAIWQKPTLNAEIAAKSKYAKYHALRILKALKAGEDPNLPEETSNPAPISPPPLDPNDPEVRNLNSLQPSVEDTSDHSRPSTSHRSIAPPSITAARSPVASSHTPAHGTEDEVSPLDPDPPNDSYFPPDVPSLPTLSADATSPSLTTASGRDVASPISPPDGDPSQFYQTQPIVPSHAPHHNAFTAPSAPAHNYTQPEPVAPISSTVPQQSAATGPEIFNHDDEAVLQASKHGKWALSALNFDDVDTAVKEFRLALQYLGARV